MCYIPTQLSQGSFVCPAGTGVVGFSRAVGIGGLSHAMLCGLAGVLPPSSNPYFGSSQEYLQVSDFPNKDWIPADVSVQHKLVPRYPA